jgi:hypothetical protein
MVSLWECCGMSNPRDWKTLVDHAALLAVQGRQCIYKERTFIRFVRVIDVTLDDWGAQLTLEILPAPSFEDSGRTPFCASGVWEVLEASDRYVFTRGLWLLVVRSDLVDRIKALAPETPNAVLLMQRINKVVFELAG